MALDRTLFSVSVKESDKGREYWLNRPWLAVRRRDVQGADILVVPWEDFRENLPALFPQGTADFVAQLTLRGGPTLQLAIDGEVYQEILLHSKMHRLPTFVLNSVLLPALAGMLGNLLTEVFKAGGENDAVHLKVIVEGGHGHCISIDYEGPVEKMPSTLLEHAERCLPEGSDPAEPLTETSPT